MFPQQLHMCKKVTTPIGDLVLYASEQGLMRIALPYERLSGIFAADYRPTGDVADCPHAHLILEEASTQITEYFAGQRHHFDLPLDRRLSGAEGSFTQNIHRAIGLIPYGHTMTYGEVAEVAGHPRAVRAVGTACSKNPLPIVVPCHRVLRADGSIGGYGGAAGAGGGGLLIKETLLSLEGAI